MSQPMSNAEFRDHIKAIVGPAPKQDKPCVRKPTDRGYYPPKSTLVTASNINIVFPDGGWATPNDERNP